MEFATGSLREVSFDVLYLRLQLVHLWEHIDKLSNIGRETETCSEMHLKPAN